MATAVSTSPAVRPPPVQGEGACGAALPLAEIPAHRSGLRAGGMCELTEELFERNRHLLGPDDDYWVGQRISRGVKEVEGDNLDHHGPNIVLECMPLPLVQRAKLFKEGIRS